MADIELKRVGAIAYREARADSPADAPPMLLVHGFPQSSYMWRHLMSALADSGFRAVALDLPGFGDSEPDPPGTWEHHIEALDRFHSSLGLGRVALGVHDWGGLIALRWACEHPGTAAALLISNTGFFPAGEWSGMGQALRTPGQGEELMENLSRDAFLAMMRDESRGFDNRALDEYWKSLSTEERKRGALELYRSGDFEKLAPYHGKLAELGAPALVLWGKHDEYAPVAGAHRFNKEIPGSKLVVLENSGHFVFEDEPEPCAREVVSFLEDSVA
jgi:haloalkane dehalogenase